MTLLCATGLLNAGFLRPLPAIEAMNYLVTDMGRSLLDVLEQYRDAV